jgi:hypothetical protein
MDKIAAVPEPGTLALLGVAGIVAAAAARRKREELGRLSCRLLAFFAEYCYSTVESVL